MGPWPARPSSREGPLTLPRTRDDALPPKRDLESNRLIRRSAMRQPKEVIPQPPAPLSHWWRHGTLLVMMFGFTVLTVVTVLTYTNAPPIPSRVVDSTGGALFSGDEIERGQEVFLKH